MTWFVSMGNDGTLYGPFKSGEKAEAFYFKNYREWYSDDENDLHDLRVAARESVHEINAVD